MKRSAAASLPSAASRQAGPGKQIAVVKSVFRKIHKGQPMQEEEGLSVEAYTGRVGAAGAASSSTDQKRRKTGEEREDHRGRSVSSGAATPILQRISGMVFGGAGGKRRPSSSNRQQQEQHEQSPLAMALSPRQVLFSSTQDLERFGLEPGDLRENICLEMLDGDHAARTGEAKTSRLSKLHSLSQSGLVLRVGDECSFRLTFHCEPCGFVLDLLPAARKRALLGSAAGAGAKNGLPTVAQLVGFRGVLATCVTGGVVRPGDGVYLGVQDDKHHDEPYFEPLPHDVKGRVLQLLQTKVPCGRVVTIRDLLHYVGAPGGYARALPAMLKAAVAGTKTRDGKNSHSNFASTTNVSVEGLYRLVDSHGLLLERHLPGQKKRLEAEGVLVEEGRLSVVGLAAKTWRPTHAELFLVERK